MQSYHLQLLQLLRTKFYPTYVLEYLKDAQSNLSVKAGDD